MNCTVTTACVTVSRILPLQIMLLFGFPRVIYSTIWLMSAWPELDSVSLIWVDNKELRHELYIEATIIEITRIIQNHESQDLFRIIRNYKNHSESRDPNDSRCFTCFSWFWMIIVIADDSEQIAWFLLFSELTQDSATLHSF